MDKQSTLNQDSLERFISDGTQDRISSRYASLSNHAQKHDFGELERNLVVLDTETTGISFHHDELTQIAAARYECGVIEEWFVTFVNPGKSIPSDVARLTNIHDDDVCDAPSPSEALEKLTAFIGDAKIVAHNIDFDRTFTTRHPEGYPLLNNTWIDSLDLARVALPRLKSHRLIDLVKAFGAPLSTHRADADVEATCAIYRVLLAGVWAMPTPLIREISQMATQDEWSTQVVFEQIANMKEIDVSRETFSLKSLRRARLTESRYESKTDADSLVSNVDAGLELESLKSIETAFSKEGIVGLLYDNFEPRFEQMEMAKAVQNAINTSTNLVVEAGTGVGKSMAYLVPEALMAQKNNITVGVATKTNALLDQLLYHELPALSEALLEHGVSERPLTYAALKGFSHYPCLRRVEKLVAETAQTRLPLGKDESRAPALAGLLSYIEQSEYEDIDGLKINFRILPRRLITTTSKDCMRRKCPFFGTSCFVHGSRRRAEEADIVVTNHSLLLCDLVADGGLLPPVRYWAIDEAHGIEAEARKAFSVALSAEDMTRLAHRVNADDQSRNAFVRAERKVVVSGSEEGSTLFYALTNKAREAGKVYAEFALEFASHMKDLLFFDQNKRGKGYETVELWLNDDIRASATFKQIVSMGIVLRSSTEKLIKVSQELVAYLEEVDSAAEVQREIASIALELKAQLNAAEVILHNPSHAYAYSATLNRKKDRPVDKLEALLVNVGEMMNDTLFSRTHSVVFASATLSVDNSFASFERALGLNASEASTYKTVQLDSSYDFDANMTVYVASDMPEPNDSAYLGALQNLLILAHRAQEGSMLTLFTNRKEMEKSYAAVSSQLKEDNLRIVCQKWGVSVKGLRDDFLTDEHLSLFALKSFWEGFDAPGSTLKGVVIPKLPFAKPTDPLSCERAQRDDQAWRHYSLPAAVLETKQAAGRLIRKADDEGVLILADKRLLTKSYGKSFLNSMPSRTIKVMTMQEIAEDIAKKTILRKG